MFNSFRSATSCGLLGLCIVVGYSQSAGASLINVSPTASGSVFFEVQTTSGGPFNPTGPATLSAINSFVDIGSASLSGTHYAKASNSYSQSSTTINISTEARLGINSNFFMTDYSGKSTSSVVVPFEVNQNEFYRINYNIPQPGSSYVSGHSTPAYKLESLIGGNPVVLQSGGYGIGQTNQIQLFAGVPYAFTFSTKSEIFRSESSQEQSVAANGNVVLALVPEPAAVSLLIPAVIFIGRRRNSSRVRA